MDITGIICEYNPLHLGHKKQLDFLHSALPDSGIVCLMSGNYVQRGAPAIIDKTIRAKAAVQAGADLVLELPTTVALSSAEGFAAGGVSILSPVCNRLCFGAETPDGQHLMAVAQTLLGPDFSQSLKSELEKGLSFPAARQKALEKLGVLADCLSMPNNILAVEYCKAIVSQGSKMQPLIIKRQGGYHETIPDKKNPSATALRQQMLSSQSWQDFVPEAVRELFQDAVLHATDYGEQAILARLRTMTDAEFENLPYGSEGLWRKLMRASRQYATLEEILTAVKSKRYTRTRLDRMLLCAYLGIDKDLLSSPAPYVRVLAFNDRGREILRLFRQTGDFPNIGEVRQHPWQLSENRWGSLYGLFAKVPEIPGKEKLHRVYYHKNGEA